MDFRLTIYVKNVEISYIARQTILQQVSAVENAHITGCHVK
jgi:hypothetical protein